MRFGSFPVADAPGQSELAGRICAKIDNDFLDSGERCVGVSDKGLADPLAVSVALSGASRKG